MRWVGYRAGVSSLTSLGEVFRSLMAHGDLDQWAMAALLMASRLSMARMLEGRQFHRWAVR